MSNSLRLFLIVVFSTICVETTSFSHDFIDGRVRHRENSTFKIRNATLVVELRLTRDGRRRPIGRTRIFLNENSPLEISFRLKYPLAKISPFNTYVLSARIRNEKNRLIFIGDLPVPVTENREKKAKNLLIEMIETPPWHKNIGKLSPLAYKVTQLAGTEEAFSSELYANKRHGIYTCVVCNSSLFSSEHKYLSGTGWPSFYQTIDETSVATNVDRKFGLTRTEVHCEKCKAHLGHVFDDGPQPTYLRYCINGVALEFIEN